MARNRHRRGRPRAGGDGHRKVLWLVNGVLIGVGGVFLSTASVLVTAIATVAAVAIAVAVIVITG
ncbi:hypothetical protein [Dactylosporangium sp. NPDC048998]|uniref:hypothetical protein n=1 Tax=Dactylosporangium sp. NPDC048998 TaxID=3363976 RepID=UPI003719ABD3